MGDTDCVVCGRRRPERGHVCGVDRQKTVNLLTDLPRKMSALEIRLVPGGVRSLADWVSVKSTGSPTGARLDALSLLVPGSSELSSAALACMLHPKIRKWRSTETVVVRIQVGDTVREERRDIVVWQQEPVRDTLGRTVRVVHDDQFGVLPPGTWLAMWSGRWRARLDHATVRARRAKTVGLAEQESAELAQWKQHKATVLAGMSHYLPPSQRPDDPLQQEWELRFGPAHPYLGIAEDTAWLLTWLDTACDQDFDIADFAVELRSLSEELARVLGERPDQQWLGRCPAQLTTQSPGGEEGPTRPCGAGLWQDPYASQVACPRCRATWGPKVTELLQLAGAIRNTWPVDGRRRYTRGEIEDLATRRPLRCAGCGGTAAISWREITARSDRERGWRAHQVFCPSGCPDPGRLM